MKNKIPSTRNKRLADEENGASTDVSSNDDANVKGKGREELGSNQAYDRGETGVNTYVGETLRTARVATRAAHQYSSAVNVTRYQDLRSRLLASGHSTSPDMQPQICRSHQAGVPTVSTLQQLFQLQQQQQQTNVQVFPSLSAPAQASTNLLSLLRQDQQRLVSLIAAAARPQQPTGVQQQQLPISEQLSPLLSVLSQQHQRSFVQPVSSSSLQQNPFQPRLGLDALAPLPVVPMSSSGSGNLPDALTALVAQNIFFGGIGHAAQEGSTRNAQPTTSAPSDKVCIQGRPSSPSSQQQEQQRRGLPYALKKSPDERLNELSRDQRESQQGLESTRVPPHDLEDGTARDKGTMVLPCGARGMPQDHNFQNAYLVIPPSIAHGDELICSYKSCSQGGAKFRFCSVCRIPVAKRNFHQRHFHDGVVKTPTTVLVPHLASSVFAATMSTTTSTGGGGKLKQERPPEGAPHDSSAGNHNNVVSTRNAKPAATLRPTGKNLSANASASTTTLSVEGVGPSWRPDDSSHVPADRQQQWAGLLHSRPASDDMDGMSIWLLQVMAISDCNNNTNKNDTSLATKTNSCDDPRSSLSRTGGRSSTTSTSSSSSSSEDIKKEGNNRKKRRKLVRMQGKDGGDK